MVLVWLNKVEVGSFALREAILSVKLKLSSNNWVFSPAVHVKSGFSKNEDTSISKTVGNTAVDGATKGSIRYFGDVSSNWSRKRNITWLSARAGAVYRATRDIE